MILGTEGANCYHSVREINEEKFRLLAESLCRTLSNIPKQLLTFGFAVLLLVHGNLLSGDSPSP